MSGQAATGDEDRDDAIGFMRELLADGGMREGEGRHRTDLATNE
jgi:hypothetical protein